jgi:hypothetical protein
MEASPNLWKNRAEIAEETIKQQSMNIKILGWMLTITFLLYVFK